MQLDLTGAISAWRGVCSLGGAVRGSLLLVIFIYFDEPVLFRREQGRTYLIRL